MVLVGKNVGDAKEIKMIKARFINSRYYHSIMLTDSTRLCFGSRYLKSSEGNEQGHQTQPPQPTVQCQYVVNNKLEQQLTEKQEKLKMLEQDVKVFKQEYWKNRRRDNRGIGQEYEKQAMQQAGELFNRATELREEFKKLEQLLHQTTPTIKDIENNSGNNPTSVSKSIEKSLEALTQIEVLLGQILSCNPDTYF